MIIIIFYKFKGIFITDIFISQTLLFNYKFKGIFVTDIFISQTLLFNFIGVSYSSFERWWMY